MTRHERFWRRSGKAAALAAALAGLWSCAQPARVRMRETLEMGKFRVRVESVTVEDRRHQGVPVEVRVRLNCDGGNRFERMDFAETMNRKGKAWLMSEEGWRERVSFLTSGEDARALVLQAYPPRDMRNYVLRIDNPYGKPKRLEVELVR